MFDERGVDSLHIGSIAKMTTRNIDWNRSSFALDPTARVTSTAFETSWEVRLCAQELSGIDPVCQKQTSSASDCTKAVI